MNFTTRSTFSTNHQSLGSVQAPSYCARLVSSAASVYAGAGASGSRISVSRTTSFWGSMGFGGLASGMAKGLAGMGGIQNEKDTMQMRSLETENRRLESKIREDWSDYFQIIEDLRAQIFANTVDNGRIILQIGNARLAADDFRVKYETELVMRQSVENDIHGLRKVIDGTNVTRLQLETEIEALKEEQLFMKKNHKEEVKGLQAQIASSRLTMEVDAPKSQDLAKIMADIQAQYDELELDKYCSQQIEERTTSAEVGAAETTHTELRHRVQSLETDLDSTRNLKASLENSLREVEARYTLQMEKLNRILLHLESELAQTRAEGQRQVKLEAEIATDRRLPEDGEEFNLGDGLDSSNSTKTIQKTTTRRIVDGKVVSETSDTKVLRH
uniref:IF rod domain-containing protein n=1 Tax=Macaca nemestrina TaxID=9545 RepID=A0A2K6D3G7_MACNE